MVTMDNLPPPAFESTLVDEPQPPGGALLMGVVLAALGLPREVVVNFSTCWSREEGGAPGWLVRMDRDGGDAQPVAQEGGGGERWGETGG
ncbi:hypothetical protein CFC21_083819 [Triticum aestivum]|uniref:Uncharacterized protein n=2 Tax=Triticum aestivum TaxID=4565 RepID=A0A3B6NRM7_WHEAT|nr:hypothetical protein CFC21_083819 [Triticum aestivum]